MKLEPCHICGNKIVTSAMVGKDSELWRINCRKCENALDGFVSREVALLAWRKHIEGSICESKDAQLT